MSKKQEMCAYLLAFYFSISVLGETNSYVYALIAYFLTIIDVYLVESFFRKLGEDKW